VAVVTPDKLPGTNVVNEMVKDMPFLADDEIQYQGEPLALVAAPTREQAQDAARHVHPRIEEQPSIQTLHEVVPLYKAGDPRLHQLCAQTIEKGDTETGFSEADMIIEEEYWSGHHEQAYLEPQGMLVIPQDDGGVFIQGSMQCPYFIAPELVETLDLPVEKIRVRQAVVGGAFGGKEEYPTWLAGYTALLALEAKRPVKIIYDRNEDILFTPKRHPCWTRYRTGLKKDGTITAVHVDYLLDGGAYTTLSKIVLARGILHTFIGYRCDHVFINGTVYRTNSFPCGAFRGFGAPQAFWGLESHVDRMAEACGMAPHEFRLKNAVHPGDTTATGQVLGEDEATDAVIRKALEMSRYTDRLDRCTRGAAGEEKWYGIGLSFFSHGAAFTGDGEARFKAKVALELDWQDDAPAVLARVSSVEMGQGAHTVLSQIVADALSVDYRRVRTPLPDTSLVPDSGPTVASRTTMIVGNALHMAALKMKDRLEKFAAEHFYDDRPVTLRDDMATDGDRVLPFIELAGAFYKEMGPLRVTHRYELDPAIQWDQKTFRGDAYPSYSWGCNVAEVEIDPLTFEIRVTRATAVYDVGRVINPMLARGQAEGGMLQAMGYAVMENIGVRDGIYDAARFQTYTIPTALDVPEFDIAFIEFPYEYGPPGAKGLGEVSIDGLAPAIGNAIRQAAGVRLHEIPMLPEHLLTAVRKEQS
jgi:CO/xanthine dehydrogenase Mo-binding subunit